MNKAETARSGEDTRVLYLALELGRREWKLGFATGMGRRPRERTVKAGDIDGLEDEIRRARRRFGLGADAPVVSCYEAGRDGFWIHRFLESVGVGSHVVDSASIEVKRRGKRRKTDRLDLWALLRLLIRYWGGEKKVWSVVHVPSPEAEDLRHLHRELETLKADRTRVTNRIKGLLAGQGVLEMEVRPGFEGVLESMEIWDGLRLGDHLKGRLKRDWAKVEALSEQIREVEAERRALLKTSTEASVEMIRQLQELRGIGETSSWLFVTEFFGWRVFRNRREVGGLAGLAPTPNQSGEQNQEQGIDKAGNRHVRGMAIEIAWGWLRYQPGSALSRWYREKWGEGSSRMRRIGIVALARKLLVELWRYLQTGALPEGATTKA
jgi:transposase